MTAQSRTYREEQYRGKDYLKKLSTQKITVCGAGAIGSNLVDTLSKVGFTQIRVIDKDRIELSNVGTQIWSHNEVGGLKADTLKARIYANTRVEIEAINKELTEDNARKLLKDDVGQLVVDCFDNSTSRKLVQDECQTRGYKCLHVGLSDDGYGEVVWDSHYKVRKDAPGDPCEYALARNLVLLTVAIACEEVLDYCLHEKPRMKDWSVTLQDLAIRLIK